MKYFKASEELTQPEDSSGGEDDVAREEARGDVEILTSRGEPQQAVQSDVIVKITIKHYFRISYNNHKFCSSDSWNPFRMT